MLKFLLPLIAALKVDGAQAGLHVGTVVAHTWIACRDELRKDRRMRQRTDAQARAETVNADAEQEKP